MDIEDLEFIAEASFEILKIGINTFYFLLFIFTSFFILLVIFKLAEDTIKEFLHGKNDNNEDTFKEEDKK